MAKVSAIHAWNRLVAVDNSTGNVAYYTYDGLNRVIEVTENGTITDLYYSSSDQVVAEYQGNTATAYNVWSGVYVNALVLRNVYQDYHWQPFYAVQDANWNVTALVNATGGVVVERYAYDPYGAVMVFQPNWQPESSSHYDVPYGFQDMRYDWTTIKYFADNRVYDPALMRWLQTDPIGLNAGNNDYAMGGDQPTDTVDPLGLSFWSSFWEGAKDRLISLVTPNTTGFRAGAAYVAGYGGSPPGIGASAAVVGDAAKAGAKEFVRPSRTSDLTCGVGSLKFL